MVEIHQARDHDLDKIRAEHLRLGNQRAILAQILEAAADEAAVMAATVDRKRGRAVIDVVFRCKPRRRHAHAPGVAAVAQEGHALRRIRPQALADQRLIRLDALVIDCGAIIHAVQYHMNMAVARHGFIPLYDHFKTQRLFFQPH